MLTSQLIFTHSFSIPKASTERGNGKGYLEKFTGLQSLSNAYVTGTLNTAESTPATIVIRMTNKMNVTDLSMTDKSLRERMYSAAKVPDKK